MIQRSAKEKSEIIQSELSKLGEEDVHIPAERKRWKMSVMLSNSELTFSFHNTKHRSPETFVSSSWHVLGGRTPRNTAV